MFIVCVLVICTFVMHVLVVHMFIACVHSFRTPYHPHSSLLQQEMLWSGDEAINSADDLQIPLNKDGKNGEDDPSNSMVLIIKWLTTQANYKRFCDTL